MVGSTVGQLIDSTWLCWAIDLSKTFDRPDERLLRLSAERVLLACFTGYHNSVLTL
jgi:hypothetical protein